MTWSDVQSEDSSILGHWPGGRRLAHIITQITAALRHRHCTLVLELIVVLILESHMCEEHMSCSKGGKGVYKWFIRTQSAPLWSYLNCRVASADLKKLPYYEVLESA